MAKINYSKRCHRNATVDPFPSKAPNVLRRAVAIAEQLYCPASCVTEADPEVNEASAAKHLSKTKTRHLFSLNKEASEHDSVLDLCRYNTHRSHVRMKCLGYPTQALRSKDVR